MMPSPLGPSSQPTVSSEPIVPSEPTVPSQPTVPNQTTVASQRTLPAQQCYVDPQISEMITALLVHVIRQNPKLLPQDPSKQPITSTHVNNIAHAMWQVAFRHGVLLQRACQYAALLSPLKLAALAKLNYLPSWWFFRCMALKDIPGLGQGWILDDREMDEVWRANLKWCAQALGPARVEKRAAGHWGPEGTEGKPEGKPDANMTGT